jgi:flagellar motility protein MotE (MotC chaperone)
MIRRFRQCLRASLCLAALAASAGASGANEGAPPQARQPEARQKEAASEPKLEGVRRVPIRKPALAPSKPLGVDGMKGVENFCGAIAASAASTRLAWQEQRIRTLQGELVVKIAELDAKSADLRQWVQKREQLLAKANESLTAIFAKMRPEAASAQMQAMDDDSAAALLAKLKPAVASAVMSEMDPARAARLSDLLSAAKSDEKKS